MYYSVGLEVDRIQGIPFLEGITINPLFKHL
jgi:hypothetical protein